MAVGAGFRCLAMLGVCAALVACGHDSRSAGGPDGGGDPAVAGGGPSGAGSAQGGAAAGAAQSGSAGSGGSSAAGQAGALNGGSGGSGGSGGGSPQTEGGAPQVALHTCPATPDPACPAKVHTGSVTVVKDSDITALEGVTSLDGDFTVLEGKGFDALHCLETVTGKVEIGGAIFADDSLWGLRNLKTVGHDISITGGLGRFYIDCAFRQLETFGSDGNVDASFDGISGLTGELDLSKLKRLRHFRIDSSNLTHISLPHSGTFEMSQLFVENEPHLTQIDGFDAVTLTAMAGSGGGDFDSVHFIDNPQLSDCKARALAKLFADAGYPAKGIVVMGNAPCTM